MANADDLRRLAEEVASAYEERVQCLSAIKQETADLLDAFGKAREGMAADLRAGLAKVKPELEAAESERKAADQAEIREREDYIEKLLADFDKAHKDMADNLRAELAKVKPELEAAESERKAADQAEIRETAAAWKGLLSAMQAARGRTVVAGPVEVEAAVEVKTVEEAIEEPVEEVDEMEEAVAEEEISEKVTEDKEDRIMDLLKGNPEGLKMAQIADMLGIENWRTLIPIMRELFDDGKIRKEGTLYFLSE